MGRVEFAVPDNSTPSDRSQRRSEKHSACLGLGSNLDAEHNLRTALKRLEESLIVLAVSSAWQSPAEGSAATDYLNAALLISTDMDQDKLVSFLKQVEQQLGRVPSNRLSLPIDIDLLTYDGIAQRPDVWNRAYCAVPAAELLPDFRPNGTTESLAKIAQRLAAKGSIRLKPNVFSQFVNSPMPENH